MQVTFDDVWQAIAILDGNVKYTPTIKANNLGTNFNCDL